VPEKKTGKIPLSVWRSASQTTFLAFFLFLFIKTDYSGSDEIPYAVNVLFRIDPLIAASATLAAKAVIPLVLPALGTLALTLLLGRFFCGWVCPLGTLLDGVRHLLPRKREPGPRDLRWIKYLVLTLCLTGAFSGLPVVGYVDPFSILVRSLALTVYPALHAGTTGLFTFTYHTAPDWVNAVTEPVYGILRETVLPFRQKVFTTALLSGAVLLGVFLLELRQRRFFCRNLCPLGAMLGLFARFSGLSAHGSDGECGKCAVCARVCRMGAIEGQGRISPEDCSLCLDCVDVCPQNRIGFGFFAKRNSPAFHLPSRRAFLWSITAGAVAPLFLKTRGMTRVPDPLLIRPPGALAEEEFLDLCVRCGECMQVCIGNALHPAFLEAGIEGMFTPKLVPRIGYCEYNCTLCGQVCPTGAIRRLAPEEKHRTVIGQAVFDTDRCLPYARGVPCIVCEEHCPTPDKAIKFREVMVVDQDGTSRMVKQPYCVERLCVGCGICETRCPLPGRSAVAVTRAGESRHPGLAGSGPY